jgi:hypothetical protein
MHSISATESKESKLKDALIILAMIIVFLIPMGIILWVLRSTFSQSNFYKHLGCAIGFGFGFWGLAIFSAWIQARIDIRHKIHGLLYLFFALVVPAIIVSGILFCLIRFAPQY